MSRSPSDFQCCFHSQASCVNCQLRFPDEAAAWGDIQAQAGQKMPFTVSIRKREWDLILFAVVRPRRSAFFARAGLQTEEFSRQTTRRRALYIEGELPTVEDLGHDPR
jgi:hypothetical protein